MTRRFDLLFNRVIYQNYSVGLQPVDNYLNFI